MTLAGRSNSELPASIDLKQRNAYKQKLSILLSENCTDEYLSEQFIAAIRTSEYSENIRT